MIHRFENPESLYFSKLIETPFSSTKAKSVCVAELSNVYWKILCLTKNFTK